MLSSETRTPLADALACLEDALQRSIAYREKGEASDPPPMHELQKLLALAVRLYASEYHAGCEEPIFPQGHGVSATDVMVASTAMLKAVNIQLFELGMWQMWAKR